MSRILVVYFSRTGTVRGVGRRLATLLAADVEEIEDRTDRTGWRGFARSGYEARTRRLAAIEPSLHDPAAYDLVVVGTPVWFSSLSSPVRAYLRRHRGKLRATAFFYTCGGNGTRRVLDQMREESAIEPVAQLAVRQDDVVTVNATLAIERFAADVRAAAPQAEVRRASAS